MTGMHDPKETERGFHEIVNMTAATLRRWLKGDGSKSVGMTPGGERVTEPGRAESVGRPGISHQKLCCHGLLARRGTMLDPS